MPLPKQIVAERKWFSMFAKTTKDKEGKEQQEAEVLIYDYIGWGGVMAKDFVTAFNALKNERITVGLNTPGGDVFDGLAIFNAIKNHAAHVTIRIDSLAASIGSVIALAGDTIQMAASAFLMVHNPWGLCVGNASEMRAMAATLEKVGGSLEKIYQRATGMSAKAVKLAMDEETWYTAEEAKAAGFVQEILGQGEEQAASAESTRAFDLSSFGYAKAPDAYLARFRQMQGGTDLTEEEAARTTLMRQRFGLVEREEMSRQ